MNELKATFAIVFLTAISIQAAIIKRGDVVEITVGSHPEHSGRFVVSENGTIDYPFLSDETIVNLSTAELMNALTFRLAKYLDNPMVTISIVENPEINVTVLGVVNNPGPVKTYEGTSIQEVIQAAGGTNEAGDIEKIKIIHKKPMPSTEYFDMAGFLKDGEMSTMPTLHNGDVVIVLTQKESKKIKVIGAVKKPGFFNPGNTDINVFELIYMAGGPAEKADLSRVRRFFQHEGKTMEEVLDIQSYIDNGQMDDIPMVDPGDVIIVYSKWFDWKTMLAILNNVLLFIVTVQTFGGVFK